MRNTVRRHLSLLPALALATAVGTTPVAAQEESTAPATSGAPASCAILTADEVSAALGETLTLVDGEGADCQFDADYEAMRFLSLFLSVAEDTTTDQVVGFLCPAASPEPDASSEPCGVEVPVGDTMGAYIPEGFGTMLYVDAGSGDLLTLQLVGDPVEGVDRLAALQALGVLALPRMATLPEPDETTDPAEPSSVPDNELEALFPTDIGGTPLTVDSMQGADVFSDADVPQVMLDALAAQGKTLDDVSIATGYAFDAQAMSMVVITALRVRGADVTTMADDFVSVINDEEAPAEQTTATIGGKEVTVVRPTAESTDDELQYVYPKDDVLWVVGAVEPALSEVFSKLP